MSDSLRDQLLGLGFKQSPKPSKPAAPPRQGPQKQSKQTRQPTPKAATKPRTLSAEDMDLAKAYALRAQREKDERIAAEKLKQEEARQRREAKAKLAELLKDRELNDPNAGIARHFSYGGKIKRIYVTEPQLKALNAGELGVVQLNGRYLLVAQDILEQTKRIFAPAVALDATAEADSSDGAYSDAQYRVPDDLIW